LCRERRRLFGGTCGLVAHRGIRRQGWNSVELYRIGSRRPQPPIRRSEPESVGAAYDDRLAKRGYDLILVARNAARLKALSARLTSETGCYVTPLRGRRRRHLLGAGGRPQLGGTWIADTAFGSRPRPFPFADATCKPFN